MKNNFLETIKAVDGKVYNIAYHQERYETVLKSLNIKNIQNLLDFLTPPKTGMYRCRLIYSAYNSNISVSYHTYCKRTILSLKIINDNLIEYNKKYENRDYLNKLFLKKENCNDILIVKNGYITDTSIANIAFYDGEKWYTPRNPLLKGTTRERYLKEGKIIEADIKIIDLKNYSQVSLLNAMIDFDIITNITYQY